MNYKEQYKDPRWQKKRLEILERDGWKCKNCEEDKEQLHVHHKWYLSEKKIWEYQDECYSTLCHDCHDSIHHLKSLIKELIDKHFVYDIGLDIIYNIIGHCTDLNMDELLRALEYIKNKCNV